MKTSKTDKSNQGSGSMSSQKTNEDFNKKKPEPKDFPEKKRKPTEKTPNIGEEVEEIPIDEPAEENEIDIEKQLDEKIVNGNSNGKFDINQPDLFNPKNNLF